MVEKIKDLSSLLQRAKRNIDGWNKFKNRNLCVIPTDSEYYKEFKEFINKKGSRYDGDKEISPMYVNIIQSNKLADLMIAVQEKFIVKRIFDKN